MHDANRAQPPRAGRTGGGMALRIVVSGALITALLWLLDTQQIGAALLSAHWPWLVLLLVLALGERIYSAGRWYQLLRWNGANVPLPAVLRISFISAFGGLAMPGALGTEALRVIGLARYSSNAAMAVSSVLVDRVFATMTLLPFVLVGVALAPAHMPDGIALTAWVLLGLVLLSVFLALHAAPRRISMRLVPGGGDTRGHRLLERLFVSLDQFRGRPRMLVSALALAVGFQLFRVAVVWVSALAVGIEVAPAYYLVFAPVIVLLVLAPISFAGIGVREAAYVYLFALVGVPAEQAFAASILCLAAGIVSSLPGAWLLAGGETRAPRPRTQETI